MERIATFSIIALWEHLSTTETICNYNFLFIFCNLGPNIVLDECFSSHLQCCLWCRVKMALDEQIVHNKCYDDHMWDFYDDSKLYSLKTKQDLLDQ